MPKKLVLHLEILLQLKSVSTMHSLCVTSENKKKLKQICCQGGTFSLYARIIAYSARASETVLLLIGFNRSIRAGFTNRLYRLTPRASRSKGPPEHCGTQRVNCRYMISSMNIRQNLS